MQVKTMFKEPNEHQLQTVASAIHEELPRNWDTSHITDGIQRVRVNEFGIISDVYVSPGLFASLCHIKYGNRSRKPFQVNSFRVLMWRTYPK